MLFSVSGVELGILGTSPPHCIFHILVERAQVTEILSIAWVVCEREL